MAIGDIKSLSYVKLQQGGVVSTAIPFSLTKAVTIAQDDIVALVNGTLKTQEDDKA